MLPRCLYAPLRTLVTFFACSEIRPAAVLTVLHGKFSSHSDYGVHPTFSDRSVRLLARTPTLFLLHGHRQSTDIALRRSLPRFIRLSSNQGSELKAPTSWVAILSSYTVQHSACIGFQFPLLPPPSRSSLPRFHRRTALSSRSRAPGRVSSRFIATVLEQFPLYNTQIIITIDLNPRLRLRSSFKPWPTVWPPMWRMA